MKDFLLILQYFFNWRFLVLLSAVTSFGLLLPEKNIKLFRSVRFNIYLFLVIAVASAAGTFLPQEKASEVVYHSWWFAALLALMAFDVIVCKLRRLPLKIFGSSKPRASETIEQFFSKSKLRANIASPDAPAATVAKVRHWLEKKNLSFEQNDREFGPVFFAWRHGVQRWGDFILHVSIVAVLAGNLIGAMFGFEEILPIEEGRSVIMKNRPFEVTLNDFEIDYYKNSGAPSVYASDLTVRQDGKEIAHKRILVNYPLDIDRVRFYQASWGMTNSYHTAKLLLAGREIEVRQGEITPIPGTPLSVRANEFLPSFDIDADHHATTKDFEGKNPALQIDFLENGKVQAKVWLLKNMPHVAFQIVGDRVTPAAPPPFHLLDVDPILFSGIQVRYDPGAPLFWASAIVLLVGLCMHFYLHQRRLRIVVHGRSGGSEVIVGGWNSRTPEEFKDEFAGWISALRETIS